MSLLPALLGGSPVRTRPFPQWPVFDHRELTALTEVLESGIWGMGGNKVPFLEREFAAYHGVRHAVAAANGTVTLEMALRSAGVKPGDEVIIPAYTFYATMSAVLVLHAVPVFADISPETYCIDPASVAGAITGRTKAIIPVFFAGNIADMEPISAAARNRGITVIVDAAHAHASEWNGQRAGKLGDMSSFSFQSSKNVTSGEGGIVTTDNAGFAASCRSFGDCGREEGRPWYEHHRLGNNYRMTEFQAAILVCQMQRLDAQTDLRIQNAHKLIAGMRQFPGLVPLGNHPCATRQTYHIFVLRYRSEEFADLPRDTFLSALRAEGIPAQPGYIPLYRAPMFFNGAVDVELLYKDSARPVPEAFPVTERASNGEAVWLPQKLLLGDEQDIQDIIDSLSKLWEHRHLLKEKSR